MILELSLVNWLKGDSAVASYVEDRIYPLIRPPKCVHPCVVYSRLGTLRSQTLCATDKKVRATMEIDVYSKDYLTGKLTADAIRQTLVDFAGDMAGTRVSTVILDTDQDFEEPEPGLYRVLMTFFIWYIEE